MRCSDLASARRPYVEIILRTAFAKAGLTSVPLRRRRFRLLLFLVRM